MDKYLLISAVMPAVIVIVVLIAVIILVCVLLKDKKHDCKIELLKFGVSLQFNQHDKTE